MPSRNPKGTWPPELKRGAGHGVPFPQGGGESGRRKWEASEPRTVGWALRTWTAVLVRAGIEGAGGDVRRLVAGVLGAPAAALLREPERVLTDAQLATLESCIARRANREPVSRILGRRDFYGRSFTITPATLDPRPDSETLIAA